MSRLSEIKQRTEKATSGPWETKPTPIRGECLLVTERLVTERHGTFSTRSVQMKEGDAEFAAHSREDIPYLLEVVEKLLPIVDDAKDMLDQMRLWHDCQLIQVLENGQDWTLCDEAQKHLDDLKALLQERGAEEE